MVWEELATNQSTWQPTGPMLYARHQLILHFGKQGGCGGIQKNWIDQMTCHTEEQLPG